VMERDRAELETKAGHPGRLLLDPTDALDGRSNASCARRDC
jgi:hypothetical protein